MQPAIRHQKRRRDQRDDRDRQPPVAPGALQAIGTAYGQTADQSAQYAAQIEPKLEAAGPTPTGAPVLLAPSLYSIVERMGQLTSQLTDAGIKEMTQSTPSATASPTPSATASARPSPSPTR